MKALLVEPSTFLRTVIGSIFARHNIAYDAVVNGESALAALAGGHRDLLCFSFELGDMRGTELLREARQRGLLGLTTALMLTSRRERAVFAEALAVGVSECFLKSDLNSFEAYVEQWEKSVTRRLSGRVLLVEDSITAARFYREVMSGLGLDVFWFKSAEDAITSLAQQDYQIVVTDYVLDGFQTGLSLIRAVRSQPGKKGEIPILALSALGSASRRVDLLRAGANDFVNKPVVAEELAARLGNLLTLRQLWEQLEAQHELLKELALRDHLTSLRNRHYLHGAWPQILARARQEGLVLAVVDVDHFKRVNDEHGHARGDEVLIAIAELLRASCRLPQEAIRYGGEEFLLLLPATPLADALRMAEELCAQVAASRPAGMKMTVSIGVSSLQEGDDFDRLFARADVALYECKQSGRNCVRQR